MNVQLRHGLHGLGDTIDDYFDDWFSEGGGHSVGGDLTAGAGTTSDWGDIDPATGLYWSDPARQAAGSGASSIIPYGQAAGAMTGKPVAWNPAQLATAIASGSAVLSRTLGKSCPSNYASPQGVCIPVAGTPGAPLIPGIPNQTLAIVGIGFVALMLLKGGGRR